MPVSATGARLLRFDNFELDLRAGELRKKGVRLRLQGQPLQVLGMLALRAGELITREELRDQLWPADTFVDFDHSLHNAVARVREVLGDSAEAPRYIETLPRRGYRFLGHVTEISPSQSSSSPALAANAEAAPRVTWKRRLRSHLVFDIALCLVVTIAVTSSWRRAATKTATIRSIAVLPMANLSGDPSQDYFADGMTEELITELSRLRDIKVTSRTSVMEYKDTTKHLPQIARELGVDGIVEGSVHREGDQVRITVQLLDGPDDRQLWSEDYQHEVHGILALQRQMAQAIAQQIRIELTPQQQTHLQSGSPRNP